MPAAGTCILPAAMSTSGSAEVGAGGQRGCKVTRPLCHGSMVRFTPLLSYSGDDIRATGKLHGGKVALRAVSAMRSFVGEGFNVTRARL